MDPYPPPPPPPVSHRLATLILRIFTVASLLVAIAVLVTDSGLMILSDTTMFDLSFKSLYSYRYLLGVCVIGMAYTLLQVVFTLYYISTGKRLTSPQLDFYGDKVISYLLATGVGAGFGATRDMKSVFEDTNSDKYFNKGYATSALVLIGFVFTAFLSIFSSHALPKKF